MFWLLIFLGCLSAYIQMKKSLSIALNWLFSNSLSKPDCVIPYMIASHSWCTSLDNEKSFLIILDLLALILSKGSTVDNYEPNLTRSTSDFLLLAWSFYLCLGSLWTHQLCNGSNALGYISCSYLCWLQLLEGGESD